MSGIHIITASAGSGKTWWRENHFCPGSQFNALRACSASNSPS